MQAGYLPSESEQAENLPSEGEKYDTVPVEGAVLNDPEQQDNINCKNPSESEKAEKLQMGELSTK